MQPGAELGISNRYWLVIDNVFGYFTQREGHDGEDKNAGDKVQTQETFCVKMILHGVDVRQTFLSVPLVPTGRSACPTSLDSGPAVCCVTKSLRRHKAKFSALLLPLETLNRDVRPVHPHNVERVFFTAAPT